MISVRDVLSHIMGSREGVLPAIQTFPSLDTEQLFRELRLAVRAEESARAQSPQLGAAAKASAELDIAAEIERRARKANETYLVQRELYEGRIRAAMIGSDGRVRIEAAGRGALADFGAQIMTDQNRLYNLLQEVEGREGEFFAFRQKHRLTRLPRLAAKRERILTALLLVAFVLVESIINGNFFAKGSQTGLIGGVLEACVLSLINIGFTVLYALLLAPLLSHRNIVVKGAGIVLAAVYTAGLISINLAIAHFRDLFIEGTGTVRMAELMRRLSVSPFELRDPQSLILALLGMGLAVVALLKTLGMRDPYPGFGRVGRERLAAIDGYTAAHEECLADMTRLRDEAISDLSGTIQDVAAANHDFQLATEFRSRLHRDFSAYLDHLAMAYEQLVLRFREARTRALPPDHRGSADGPGERPRYLEAPALPDVPGGGAPPGELIGRIESYINSINARFEAALGEYKTVLELTRLRAVENVTS